MLNRRIFRLVGRTDCGKVIAADTVTYSGDFLTRSEGRPSNSAGFRTKSIDVLTSEEESRTRRFRIVNFAPEDRFDFTFQRGDISVRLRPADQYEAKISTLGIRDPFAVTAIAEVSGGDKEASIDFLDTVCELLSYARGTKIQWISYEDLGTNDEILRCHFGSRITRRLTPMDLIPDGLTFAFVEKTFDAYVAFRKQFPYRKLLGLYVDACDQTDFIDVRAIKIVVLMEAVKAMVLERLLLPPRFPNTTKGAKFKKEMRNAIREAVQRLDLSNDTLEGLLRMSDGCHHHTFRESIAAVQEHLHIKIDADTISIFIDARNKLIHEATFLHLAKPDKLHPFDSHAEEYFWLVGFVDRFVLRLIGYRGAFIDRANGSEAPLVPAEPN